ncbi:MAG: hypothetical protein GX755_03910 [Syntrophomonadaceae bacterium]|nr:hypothetical protein [Syntrophomonadaceae bacterium]
MNWLIEESTIKNQTEAEILEKVDWLIAYLTAGELANQSQRDRELKPQAVEIVQEIIELLLEKFPQAEPYLDIAINQLINQKLTEPELLLQNLDLSDRLDWMVKEGIRLFRLNNLLPFEPEPNQLGLLDEITKPAEPLELNEWPETKLSLIDQNQVELSPLSKKTDQPLNFVPVEGPLTLEPLEWSLTVLYPESPLIPNYTEGGKSVQWYLPEQKLAFARKLDQDSSTTNDRKFWQQRGISLILLTEAETQNHQAVRRQIRRQKQSAMAVGTR